ncbi:MAG: restriction endonuclease subunit S [Nannocystis sp.]|nr:restriction endonuclease subunit S [Nannocystis sp.]MBA3546378.1 restriction endonuclease subunit S [Nannocystis sp.]
MTSTSGTSGATGRWPIPAAWRWARAGELAAVVGGGTPRTGDPDNFAAEREGAVAWLTPADLAGHDSTYVTHGARHLTPRGLRASAARLLPAGSVVFSSRAPIGRCAIAAAPLCTSQGFRSFVLRTPEILPEYLHLYLLAATDYAHSLASGSTFKELSGSRAAEMWVPIAPTFEQARIVAKVQGARARCARAGALLDAVPARLERLRQAILADGLSGSASATWRAAHPDGAPAAGSPARFKDGRRGRPAGHTEASSASLVDEALPPSWTLAAVGEVARVQPGFPFKSAWYQGAGVRLLRGINVAPGRTRWDDAVYLAPGQAREHSQVELAAGDLVIAMDRPLIAEGLKVCRIGAEDLPCLLVQRVGRLIAGEAVLAEYLYIYLQSRRFIDHLSSRATGTQLPHVSADDIESAPLPVPPLAEQRVIAQVVAARLERLARATQLYAGLRGALAEVAQAVLVRAFRGELVAQDPADEPAGALLERLRLAGAAQADDADAADADQPRGRPGTGVMASTRRRSMPRTK